MALIPKIEIVTASTGYQSIAVQETTGLYNGSTNLGGYGAPNPDANEMAQYLFAFKKNFSIDDEDLTADHIDNTVADDGVYNKTWSLDITSAGSDTGDGWYDFWLLLCPLWTAKSYALDQIVYDAVDNQLYIAIVASTSAGTRPGLNLTDWAVFLTGKTVSNLEDIFDDAGSYGGIGDDEVYAAKISDVMVENSEIEFANIVADACIECDGCTDLSDERKEIDTWEFFLRCVYVNESKENWPAAERSIEVLKDLANGNCTVC